MNPKRENQDALTLSANLRRLRAATDMNQAEIAAKAGISRVAYNALEQARSLPRTRTLLALSQALGVGLDVLMRAVPTVKAVRFRSQKVLRGREQIVAEIATQLQDFADLEQMLKEDVPYSLQSLPADIRRSSPQEAAEAVRRKLHLEPKSPIRDICGLLEAAGIKMLQLTDSRPGFFGLSIGAEDGGPAIVVNVSPKISVERWIYTAAHELGHLVLHLHAYEVSKSQEDEKEEQAANQFASHFLMPEASFQSEWQEAYGLPLVSRVLKTKRIFKVSYKTVLYRLSLDRAYGKDIWVRFQVEHAKQFGRTLLRADEPEGITASHFRAAYPESAPSAEPEHLSPSDFLEDRRPALVRRAFEEEHISLGRAAEIMRLPLRKMRDWASSWVS